jgi:hypothetical protein
MYVQTMLLVRKPFSSPLVSHGDEMPWVGKTIDYVEIESLAGQWLDMPFRTAFVDGEWKQLGTSHAKSKELEFSQDEVAAFVQRTHFCTPVCGFMDRLWTEMVLERWATKHTELSHIDKLLSINQGDSGQKFLRYAKATDYSYNARSRGGDMGDLHDMSGLIDRDFDFVYMPQTLEHLHNPHLALQQLKDHMRPGALLLTHQPWINKHHMTPVHMAHWTAEGLLVMMASLGFEIVDIARWGNWHYIEEVLKIPEHTFSYDESGKELITVAWPRYNSSVVGQMRSEPNMYVQTMLLVRKPLVY